MIFILIALIILGYSYRNYKQGFLCFLIFKIFLVTNITIVSIPGIPLLTVEVFMTLAMLGLFYLKRLQLDLDCSPFPFVVPFKWVIVSWFLSTIFAYVGFMGAVSQFIGRLSTEILTVWLMWVILKDKTDFLFLIKWFTFSFFIVCIYGMYEYSISSNPLHEYTLSMVNDESRAISGLYDAEKGRGYRIKSVFEHGIGAGINWAMYIIMIFMLIIKYHWKSKYTNIAIATALLSIPCLLFTNSRAPIVFLGIGCFAFFNFKNTKFYRYAIIAIILAIIAMPFFSEFTNNILSIFDSKAQAEVGGSSAEMRFDQLSAAIALMKQSPIIGFGFKFTNVMSGRLVDALLGMESIWFSTLTQFGMLGVVANGILCYYSLVKIPRKYRSKSIFFISLAYWVTASLTSVPGMLTYMYYMIIIMIIKLSFISSKQCPKYQ